MKYKKTNFNSEYYKLWEIGLLLPEPKYSSIYSVEYKKNNLDEYSRVTLKATSENDALERACYAVTYSSEWRPEDIDLLAAYDEEENLLWVDKSLYDSIRIKNEFAGMERRDFLFRFGAMSAAFLFGFRSMRAMAGTTTVGMSGTASGFFAIGEQIYTTAGSFNWTVPADVTSVCVVCVGGGGGGGFTGASTSVGLNACAGGGGGLRYANNLTVTPGASISVQVGAKGLSAYSNGYTGSNNTGTGSAGGTSFFSSSGVLNASGGGGGSANPTTSGGGAGGTGSAIGGSIGGGNGGAGGGANSGNDSFGHIMRGGGGGVGGYSGNGGAGGTAVAAGANGSAGAGGGGGGGASGDEISGAGQGGGASLSGTGTAGVGGVFNGSMAADGSTGGRNGQGGSSGAGASGQSASAYGSGGEVGDGRSGAVRIIWGPGRSFPSNAT